jgi:thiol-disulfide isomerase/thioredoxin
MGQSIVLKKSSIGWVGLLGLAAISVALIYGFRGTSSSSSAVQDGSRAAPVFELPDSKGTLHRLKDLKGRPVVLHFWASWCPPCLGEISKWVELAHRYQEKDQEQPIQWVAVSLDQNWGNALKVWMPDPKNPGILSLLDAAGTVSDQFGTYQFPETYLLNADLEIVTKWIGPQDWESSEIRKLLDHVIKKTSKF